MPDEERMPVMRENSYVRVQGHLRTFGGDRNVVAFRVMPVTDANELTSHLLEVVLHHLALTKRANAARQAATNAVSGGVSRRRGVLRFTGVRIAAI